MSDVLKAVIGLAIFFALAAFPIWYSLGIADDASAPPFPADLEMPTGSSECVKDKEYMIANHMDLLNRWRDEVVREGDTSGVEIGGRMYEKSLTKGCMSCHTSRENFCAKCHNYADVKPACWNCHVEPKLAEAKGD